MPLGTEVGLGPGDTVLDEYPAPPWKRAQQAPTFQPMSIVVKRSHISATAQLLLFNLQPSFLKLTLLWVRLSPPKDNLQR